MTNQKNVTSAWEATSDELQFISIKRITFTTRTNRTNNGRHCFTTRTTDATSILLLRLEKVVEVPGKKKTSVNTGHFVCLFHFLFEGTDKLFSV